MKTIKSLSLSLIAILFAAALVTSCVPDSNDFDEIEDNTEFTLKSGDGDDEDDVVPGG